MDQRLGGLTGGVVDLERQRARDYSVEQSHRKHMIMLQMLSLGVVDEMDWDGAIRLRRIAVVATATLAAAYQRPITVSDVSPWRWNHISRVS